MRTRRRPRKTHRAPVSSIDRSIAHAGTNQMVSSGLELGAGALGGLAIGQVIEAKGWLATTVKDTDYRRYTIGGLAMLGGLILHPYAPSLGLGAMIGGGVYAFAPVTKKAVDNALAPDPADTKQITPPPPTPPPTPPPAPTTP